MPIEEHINFGMAGDTYKDRHWEMQPPGTTGGKSYIESRVGGEFSAVRFFGLQAYLMKYLTDHMEMTDYENANVVLERHCTPLPPYFKELIEDQYTFWPLRISALPEGVVVPSGVPLVKIESTDPRYDGLQDWIEAQIQRGVWYPTSTATRSFNMMQILSRAYHYTGADRAMLPFALHDFGARGATSGESAAIGGAGHLVNSMGTDTKEALQWVGSYYGDPCAGHSVLATEHSVTMKWGRGREREFYEMICNKFGTRENCMISVVMDTYDQDAAFSLFCNELKPLVKSTFGSTHGAKLIFRPDSGPPEENVVKYTQQVGDSFGWDPNSNFKKMPGYLGLIQGDGIDEQSLQKCVTAMVKAELRTDNCAFGSGGGLLQKVTRDSGRFAQKACEVTVNGDTIAIQKMPKTDPSKASKAGDVAVVLNDMGVYEATTVGELRGRQNEMRVVYDNGELIERDHFSDVRGRFTF